MAENDLKVIVKAKELAVHSFKLTSNCNRYPKKYRHSLVDRIQIKSLDIYETLLEANRINVENAKAHGVNIRYGSDVFAQVVLSLEDLARMVERGIYDLSTWVAGMKYLPAAPKMEPCFAAMGFSERPTDAEAVKAQYKRMAKVMHPDAGGDAAAFAVLGENYRRCLELLEQEG